MRERELAGLERERRDVEMEVDAARNELEGIECEIRELKEVMGKRKRLRLPLRGKLFWVTDPGGRVDELMLID